MFAVLTWPGLARPPRPVHPVLSCRVLSVMVRMLHLGVAQWRFSCAIVMVPFEEDCCSRRTVVLALAVTSRDLSTLAPQFTVTSVGLTFRGVTARRSGNFGPGEMNPL
jgi:hypothetical protein